MGDDPLSADPPEDPDAWFRPPWDATPDETDADMRRQRPMPRRGAEDPLAGADPLLLATLADASDALARLDASLAAADAAVQDGLRARLALTEAAGWLAHAHAWVHPLDLALREAGLTAPAALAALGAGARALPHTLAQPTGRLAWDDPPLDTWPAADQSLADALALARLLRRLPGGGPHPFANTPATADTLTALGARIDAPRLATWWDAHALRPVQPRRFGGRGEGRAPLPPLLAGALAAVAWMTTAITDPPDPAQALLVGFGRLVRQPPARHVFIPLWSAYPAVGFGDRDALPTLRPEAVERLGAPGGSVAWPAAALHLIAESARAGLRELDRLEAAAARGRAALAATTDRRSRLPDTLDALLRAPLLTPKALAAGLRIAPQTATTALGALQATGVVKEVTGRGRFRAFAV